MSPYIYDARAKHWQFGSPYDPSIHNKNNRLYCLCIVLEGSRCYPLRIAPRRIHPPTNCPLDPNPDPNSILTLSLTMTQTLTLTPIPESGNSPGRNSPGAILLSPPPCALCFL